MSYKGQCSNGFFNGFGKKFDKNGILRYKGNFLNGLKEGKESCRLYDGSGDLIYEGSFKGDIKEGYGTFYDDNRILYRGSVSKGQFHGTFGELFYTSVE